MQSDAVIAALDPLIRLRTDQVAGDELAAAEHLSRALESFAPDEGAVVEVDRGPARSRAAYVYARWGRPRLLLNAHIDTVPVNAGWTGDPFVPRIVDGPDGAGLRLVGLGAADTKGAIAGILVALEAGRARGGRVRDLAVLFSGDEEHGNAAMRAFLDGPRARGIERAIVCEPTGCRVGTRHRGILAVELTLTGRGGHSSQADTMPAPLADLARVAVAIADWGRARRDDGPPGFPGLCVNIARLDGGVAFNVVPDQATLCVSVRPPPGSDAAAVRAELLALAAALAPRVQARVVLDNPPFSTASAAAFEPHFTVLGEAARAPVDLPYWTEAALLAAAGIDSVVFGPGRVEQAHAPDEWVSVDELLTAARAFDRAITVASGDPAGEHDGDR